MKFFYLIIALFIVTSISAQQDPRVGRHVFNIPTSLKQCDRDGTDKDNNQNIERDWEFTIENIVGTDYIIQIAKFTSGSDKAIAQNLLTYQDSTGKNIYLKISIDDYKAYAERLKPKGHFIVGASTTLIKIRPGNKEEGDGKIYSEFGNDFNIGLTVGYKFNPNRHHDLSVSGVLGLAFSSIKVTPQTTRNYITTESVQSSLTPSLGLLFEYNKFQFAAFTGIDVMFGEISHHWIYRNRPWLGIGFGYAIFQERGAPGNTGG